MTTIELKNLLIHRISEINDVSFPEAIKVILESKSEANILFLSGEQRNEIFASRKEMGQEQFIEDIVLEKEIAKWLTSK